MASIYDQHDKAFRGVSAFVILKDGKRVATVATRRVNSVTAYVHWLGIEMVKGVANGGGYDMQSAACSIAARKIPDDITGRAGDGEVRAAFINALDDRDGRRWHDRLEAAGFTVLQAV